MSTFPCQPIESLPTFWSHKLKFLKIAKRYNNDERNEASTGGRIGRNGGRDAEMEGGCEEMEGEGLEVGAFFTELTC